MEVEVLQHRGFPDTSLISVSLGATTKQMKVGFTEAAMQFPEHPGETGCFKVDVFSLAGSNRFQHVAAESNYDLVLESPPEAVNAGHMEVALRVRSTGESGQSGFRSSGGDVQVTDEGRGTAGKNYLDKHGLASFMQFLTQSLIEDQPADPYGFLQKQVTKRMVSEIAKRTVVASKDDPGNDTIPAVSSNELAALEREAASTTEQLRSDNRRLRETVAQLKWRYWQILEENAPAVQSAAPTQAIRESFSPQALSPVGACPPDLSQLLQSTAADTPQVAAYREIARMQTEVSNLAQENGLLVHELASLNSKVDTVRSEIDDLTAERIKAGLSSEEE